MRWSENVQLSNWVSKQVSTFRKETDSTLLLFFVYPSLDSNLACHVPFYFFFLDYSIVFIRRQTNHLSASVNLMANSICFLSPNHFLSFVFRVLAIQYNALKYNEMKCSDTATNCDNEERRHD